MIQCEVKTSKHDSLTSYWSIDLCLIAWFYAERDRYCRLVFYILTPSGLKMVLFYTVIDFNEVDIRI